MTSRKSISFLMAMLMLTVNSVCTAYYDIVAESTKNAIDEKKLPTFENAKFSRFSSPVIGADATVAFSAILTGPNIVNNNNETIWRSRQGSLQLIAREGDPAPGTEQSVSFSTLYNRRIIASTNRSLAFSAKLRGPSINTGNNQGIWRVHDDSLSLVARIGDGTFKAIYDFVYVDSITEGPFIAILGDDVNHRRGIWAGTPDSLQAIILSGSAAPVAGCKFATAIGRPTLNHHGQVAFLAPMIPTVSGVLCATTLYRVNAAAGSAGLKKIASQGDPIPGFPVRNNDHDPSRFGAFSLGGGRAEPKINDQGNVVFGNSVLVANHTNFVGRGSLWVGEPGLPPKLVIIQNQTLGGTSSLITGVASANRYSIGTNGRVAVYTVSDNRPGILAGFASDNSAFVRLDEFGSTQLEPIAQQGAVAAELDPITHNTLGFPVINASGKVAFFSRTNNANYGGIWSGFGSDDLKLLAYSDPNRFDETGCEPLRNLRGIVPITTAGEVSGNGTSDGLPSQFNDRGQVAFRARLANPATEAILVSPTDPGCIGNKFTP